MNKQLIFARRPEGRAGADTWKLEQHPVPPLEEGQILVQQHYVSLDPAMRGWMNAGKSYIEPMEPGTVMRALTVGRVIDARNHPEFATGDYVAGTGGVQLYTITDGKGYRKVDPDLAPLTAYLGALGMTGMTAYFGLLDVGKAREGDTVLISGAAGAVGSVAGQIAKIKGCRAIGIAGGADKCDYITRELGFDAAIDYKNESVAGRLKELCPKGLDVYFDNVGGEILDTALLFLRRHARVVICGAISQYNNRENVRGPKNYLSLLVNRASMQGMVVFDWEDRYPEAARALGGWMAEGKLKSRETVYEGIQNFPETFDRLFTGDKIGKLVLKVLEA
ncbi:NADP-dependent oxidoreductase [Robiginitalea sp. SC105]|uniref:NADP-dependent oxidoreductase n=1 Tax=Robiginitalea sp. SC105 TaxID=2762332 RepID=UPI001639EA5F|nr:NADP-dependent oxidoreductase [Robiginitalea sp. SC105]MBC2838131.1 NADP-dependent oxidoreductase [Robiginitalea sp. SC105]